MTSVKAQATRRWQETGPLLPAPGALLVGCGAELTAAGSAGQQTAAGSATWNPQDALHAGYARLLRKISASSASPAPTPAGTTIGRIRQKPASVAPASTARSSPPH